MDNRLKRLDYVFKPRSIAMVGATESMQKWGFIIFNHIISGGYQGRLYPVNPGRETVLGLKAYPSVRDIPDEVDLAVFTVPSRQVVSSINDCISRGVKAGVVISAGFKEMGGEYADLESELVSKARRGGMVLVGPNGQGICCPETSLYAWMANFFPPSGSVAVVSQSGNVQNVLVDGVYKSGFGISKGVSSGNEADLKTSDYLDYYASDPDTSVILAYMEGLSDGRGFMKSARAASSKKPVVLFKGGSTESGSGAARSHTAAMAVSDDIFNAAARQAGIIRVPDMEDAGVIASSFLNRPLPRGRRVGIITGGGGLGVVAADICAGLGLSVPKLSAKTLEKIGGMLPDWWVPGNPVDLVAGLNFTVIAPLLQILMESGEIDSIMLMFIAPPRRKEKDAQSQDEGSANRLLKVIGKNFSGLAKWLSSMMCELQVPIYVISNFGVENNIDMSAVFSEKPMTVFLSIDTACRAISAMTEYYEFRERLKE